MVVVPCFNEAERLDADAFVAFVEQNVGVKFLFVDDGSRDGTAEKLCRIVARAPDRLAVMSLPKNRGKGEAVRAGLIAALADERSRFVGFWDADLATPLADIPRLRGLLLESPDLDIVFGSRVKLLGRTIKRSPVRHYFGRMFATAASIALDLPIYDTQCGAKLFRVSDEIRSLFAEPLLAPWIFDVEILARFIRGRRGSGKVPVEAAIYEYPLTVWQDVAGGKIRLKHFVSAGINLLRIYWRYLRPGA